LPAVGEAEEVPVKPRNLLWVTLGTFALSLGVLVGGFVRTGRAQAPPDEAVVCRADFPLLRLGSKESVRVHTSWVDGDGEPINVRVEFWDRQGQVIEERTHAIAPKETISTLFKGGAPEEEAVKLFEFRTAVFVQPASGDEGFPAEVGCPQVVTSMERNSPGLAPALINPSLPIGILQSILKRPCPCPSPSPAPSFPPPADGGFPAADMKPADFGLPPADMRPADVSFPPADTFNPPPADVSPGLLRSNRSR
jgi:hypothetical protein